MKDGPNSSTGCFVSSFYTIQVRRCVIPRCSRVSIHTLMSLPPFPSPVCFFEPFLRLRESPIFNDSKEVGPPIGLVQQTGRGRGQGTEEPFIRESLVFCYRDELEHDSGKRKQAVKTSETGQTTGSFNFDPAIRRCPLAPTSQGESVFPEEVAYLHNSAPLKRIDELIIYLCT